MPLECYLVGGAVRDTLLNYPFKEKDWVVIGSSPEELRKLGYTQVGKDFPVFLHPTSKEEYALARTERKSGPGYTGFETHFASDVTLEEDLLRRDLTINAMALDLSENLIDPYGGRKDLKDRILRHVSGAFTEDPLRVLRVARFAARYAHLGFKVAEETMALMKEISATDELTTIPKERIWVETERALSESRPDAYIQVLHECGALKKLMPEVDVLFGLPQSVKHHPEGDVGSHLLLVLRRAAELARNSVVGFAALTHDLGKGVTPKRQLPSHKGHELAGLPLVKALCHRLAVPKRFQQLAELTCEHHLDSHRALDLDASELLALLEKAGALKGQDKFELFLACCEADSRGRAGYEDIDYLQADFLRRAAAKAGAVDAASVLLKFLDEDKKPQGVALGKAIRSERIDALERFKAKEGSGT
ncbi:MAG: multifunctional CCA addition/repair protein [Pseudomonadota bacterium]